MAQSVQFTWINMLKKKDSKRWRMAGHCQWWLLFTIDHVALKYQNSKKVLEPSFLSNRLPALPRLLSFNLDCSHIADKTITDHKVITKCVLTIHCEVGKGMGQENTFSKKSGWCSNNLTRTQRGKTVFYASLKENDEKTRYVFILFVHTISALENLNGHGSGKRCL